MMDTAVTEYRLGADIVIDGTTLIPVFKVCLSANRFASCYWLGVMVEPAAFIYLSQGRASALDIAAQEISVEGLKGLAPNLAAELDSRMENILRG